jgi:Flp pilus assembly pilin Flp
MSKHILRPITVFLKDESGIETIEYAIIAGIVAIVAVAVYGSGWGQAIKDKLVSAASADISGAGL